MFFPQQMLSEGISPHTKWPFTGIFKVKQRNCKHIMEIPPSMLKLFSNITPHTEINLTTCLC